MRIVCPGCAAEYEVPDSRLRPQRKLRCVRCDHAWTVGPQPEARPVSDAPDITAEPEPPVPAEPAPVMPPLTAMDRLAASAPAPRAARGLTAAWVMMLLAAIAAVAAVVVWRESVVRAWPPSGWVLGPADHETSPTAQATGGTKPHTHTKND